MNPIYEIEKQNLFLEVDKDRSHLNDMRILDFSLNCFIFNFDNEEAFILHKVMLLKTIEIKGDEISKKSGVLTGLDKAKLFRLCQLIVYKTVSMIAKAHRKNEIEYINSFLSKDYQVDVESAINYKIKYVVNRVFSELKEKKCRSEFMAFAKVASDHTINFFYFNK